MSLLRLVLRPFGYDVVRLRKAGVDRPERDQQILEQIRNYTQTGPDRVYALLDALRYVQRAQIQGAIVECGVWRGGSMMAAALAILDSGAPLRDLYLFDTFSGMSEPTRVDVDFKGRTAAWHLERNPDFNLVEIDEVERNLASTGYASDRIHFVKGKVEDTLPASAPPEIALLRLDTDWYESTKHELVHLFPRVVKHGVVIIDDYGHFEGCRKAVDEYLTTLGAPVLLNRIDYTGRIFVKPF